MYINMHSDMHTIFVLRVCGKSALKYLVQKCVFVPVQKAGCTCMCMHVCMCLLGIMSYFVKANGGISSVLLLLY